MQPLSKPWCIQAGMGMGSGKETSGGSFGGRKLESDKKMMALSSLFLSLAWLGLPTLGRMIRDRCLAGERFGSSCARARSYIASGFLPSKKRFVFTHLVSQAKCNLRFAAS